MSNNNQLLQTAWQSWHAGTGIDTEDMPPPNPSFKAGFDYGMVAAHNEHCAALIRVEELSGDAKKMVAIIGIKDVLMHRLTGKVESLTEALRGAYEAISKSDAAFTSIIERSGLSDTHTLADLAEYVRCQADIIDTCNATIRAIEADLNSQWTKIDYANPATYPDENRPCIVAWEFHPEHPERHAMHVFNDVGDDMRLWQNAISDEVHDWDGVGENPTHWMYAPEYQQ